MSSIDTGACYVGTILRDGKPYVVPKFQRDFSWTTEEVDQLWNDVFRSIDESHSSYFIGSMVINDSNSSSYDVIDGQQRLTTISILLCALRDVAKEKGSVGLSDRLASDFLGKFEYSTGETTPKLTLNVTNRQFYNEKIVNNTDPESLRAFIKNTRNTKSNRLLASAYICFREKIEKSLDGNVLLSDFIQRIVSAIDDVIQVIRITVKDDYDAYMLFETLNDRGLALSVADLLKNYLFSKADDKIEDVQENWQEMQENLGTIETKRYLRHLWLSKFGVVRDKELYSRIKEKYTTKSNVVSFSRELRDSSDIYSALADPQSSLWTMFDGNQRSKILPLLEDLNLFGVNQYNPLLLATLESNPTIFLSILRMVVAFAFRYSIIAGSGTGNIERNFTEAAVFVRNNTSCSAADVFAKIDHLYPDDNEFFESFKDKSITQSAIARYILRKINDKLEENSGLVVNKDGFAMSLEHILPQKFTDESWGQFSDESDTADYVYRIGNMTLLTSTINRKAANKSFSEKVELYSDSELLRISEELASATKWQKLEVENRQARLAKVAKQIWRVDF